MRYLGMNQQTGKAITDLDHIQQSVRDILITPEGSRLARRTYGSLLSALIDQPQNDVTRLQVMAATYAALLRWEPRIQLHSIDVATHFDGLMLVELRGQQANGLPFTQDVSLEVAHGRY